MSNPKRKSPGHVCLIACGLLLAGCTVGPKYKAPTAPIPATFKETSEWKQAEPRDDIFRGKWWEVFGDAELNALEEQVNLSNQDIAAAEAQFRAARAAIRIGKAELYPTLTVGAAPTVSRGSSNRTVSRAGFSTGTGTSSSYQIPFDLSYEADVWGRIRSGVQADIAAAEASAADLETVRLSVHAELALDYFQLRGLDEQRKLFDANIAAFERALQLTLNRYHQGIVSRVDVAQAQTQLDTIRAQATDLDVARSQFEHAIAVLTGHPPSELTIARGSLTSLPPDIPVGLPSELLERRPDIASAERRVAAANAQIGVAKAAFFPRLTLSLAGGFESSKLTNLLAWPSRFWAIGPAIAQTVFDGGSRRGITQQAEANYDSTVAAYRQNVLLALQDVDDNLSALRILAAEAAQLDTATTSAQRSLDLALNRYRGGITTYLEVVTAQNDLLGNQRAAVDISAKRMSASVLLIKALGGSW